MIDTNLWLDMLVFGNPGTERLSRMVLSSEAPEPAPRVRVLTTDAMRDELERVLRRRPFALSAARQTTLLAVFDASTQRVAVAPDCRLDCRDPDDRMFIDLAVRERCWLLTRDRALLATRRPAHRRFLVPVGTVADFYRALGEPSEMSPT